MQASERTVPWERVQYTDMGNQLYSEAEATFHLHNNNKLIVKFIIAEEETIFIQ